MNQYALDRIKALEQTIKENTERIEGKFNVSKYGVKMIKSSLRDANKRLREEIKDIKLQLGKIKRRLPVSNCAVEAYQLELPEGYKHDGNEISWKAMWNFENSTR